MRKKAVRSAAGKSASRPAPTVPTVEEAPVAEGAPAVVAAVDEALPAATRAYRWFHRHPELSGAEVETARHLAGELKVAGLEVHEGIGGHGVVAILHGGSGSGPTVLMRADMDALPITEATGLPYASANTGVMHACGHDVHMACGLGAVRALAARRSEWAGTVIFVGQPAEETGRGAREMLADRAFQRI